MSGKIKIGDIVKRGSEYRGVQEPMGDRVAFVKHMSPGVLLLGGYDTIYDPSDFEVMVAMTPEVPKDAPPDSPRLFEALVSIKDWNDNHPASMAIGVESAGPLYGGTLFTLGERFYSHEVLDVFSEVVNRMISSRPAEDLHLLTRVLTALTTQKI